MTRGPGGLVGELAQLSGRPALIDAKDPVQAPIISTERGLFNALRLSRKT